MIDPVHPSSSTDPKDLVFTTLPGQDGPTFLRRAEAHELAGVHAAIHESPTWGAFLGRLSDERRLQVVMGLRALGDDVAMPADDAPLAGIPGHDDGDWPGWGAARMLGWVPDEVQALGAAETSVFNGSGLAFAEEDTAAVVAAFERAGYRCTRDHALVCAACDYAAD